MDDTRRVAMVRVGNAFTGDSAPAVKFILEDHLGSSAVVVSDTGSWVNREEFSPYGETLFGSFARKRYRYTGQERDEESGLGYHGARYYASWLGRWVSVDPAGMVDGINTYAYSRNSPVRLRDRRGMAGEEAQDKNTGPQPRHAAEGATGATAGVATHDAVVRDAYKADNISASQKAVESIDDIGARQAEMGAEKAREKAKGIARAVSEARDEGRAAAQAKQTPVGRAVSKAMEKPPKPFEVRWDKAADALQKEGSVSDEISTARRVAAAASESRPTASTLAKTVKGVGTGLGVVTTAASAYFLYEDIKSGDVAGAVGDAAGTSSGVLTVTGGLLGSSGLAAGGAVTGSFALGYGVGSVINEHIPQDTKDSVIDSLVPLYLSIFPNK